MGKAVATVERSHYTARCFACDWQGTPRATKAQADGDAVEHNRKKHGAKCPHNWILVPPGDDHCTLCGAYR